MKGFNGRKVGLALGGGAVLGAVHIGVLRALEEADIQIACVTGTSIGSLVGAMVARGNGPQEIEDAVSDLTWFDVSGLSLKGYGILSNEKLGAYLSDKLGPVAFDDLKLPFAAIATDISSGEKNVLREGLVSDAVMASTAIPGVFAPVEIDGRMLVDGGVVENVPVSPLPDMGAKFIISVDLGARRPTESPGSIVEVILNAFNILMDTSAEFQSRDSDLNIRPDLSDFNIVDVNQTEQLIEAGYRSAQDALRDLD